MNHATALALGASLVLAFSSGSALARMSKGEFESAKARIHADLRADEAACASRPGHSADVCMRRAKGKADVAQAQLEYRYAPDRRHRRSVAIAQAKADFTVAIERCDALAGQNKRACVQRAKATLNRRLA